MIASASVAGGAAGAGAAGAWSTAQHFEALALGAFLEPMFATIDLSGTPFGGGEAEKTWQSMYVQELGKSIERAGGLGIARSVYAEMLRLQSHAAAGAGA